MTGVPSEFVGKARALCQRLAKAEQSVERDMHRVLAPLSRRLAKHPVLRQDDLVDARRRWLAIDPIARLYDSVIDISDRRNPSFLDLRVWPSRYKGMGWEEDGYEDGLAVMSLCAFAGGYSMVLNAMPLLVCGLHCLARRYQRSPSSMCDDATILAEIGNLALQFPKMVDTAAEFAFPVAGGSWRGHVVESKDNHTVVVCRTFIDGAAAPLAIAA
jgi:hypothetical protein